MAADDYLENYIIAEQKEQYRIYNFWMYWVYRGSFMAIEVDARFVVDWGIIE